MYKQGDFVEFDYQYIKGTGKVCGISNTGKVMLGKGYIIELIDTQPDYEFSHIVVYEIFMKKSIKLTRDNSIEKILK